MLGRDQLHTGRRQPRPEGAGHRGDQLSQRVFGYIARKLAETGRDLIIGMEHGNSIEGKDGELAVIDAYRKVEPR
jgi:hypothetical protein